MPTPELRAPLAVVCHDAGACNIILPWLALRRDLELRPVMQGPAAKLFAERFPNIPLGWTIDAALDGAAMVLSGTGWASELEHRARRLARERGVFSAAVIDHWINYPMRFERGGEVAWPDEFWVTDPDAVAIARRAFVGAKVRRFDNLYLRQQIDAIAPKPRRGAQLLVVLEPVRSDWGRGGIAGEFQALDHFIAARERLALPAGVPLRLRPHPSDPAGKYDAWIAAQRKAVPSLDIALDAHATLAEAISASAWVAGCESMAMVVALAAGRRVWTTLPPWAPACRLPHAGILRLRGAADQADQTNQSGGDGRRSSEPAAAQG
jgi:hypothetical protein